MPVRPNRDRAPPWCPRPALGSGTAARALGAAAFLGPVRWTLVAGTRPPRGGAGPAREGDRSVPAPRRPLAQRRRRAAAVRAGGPRRARATGQRVPRER